MAHFVFSFTREEAIAAGALAATSGDAGALAALARTIAPGKYDRDGEPQRAGIILRNACKAAGRSGDPLGQAIGALPGRVVAKLLAMEGAIVVRLGDRYVGALPTDAIDGLTMEGMTDAADTHRAQLERRSVPLLTA